MWANTQVALRLVVALSALVGGVGGGYALFGLPGMLLMGYAGFVVCCAVLEGGALGDELGGNTPTRYPDEKEYRR